MKYFCTYLGGLFLFALLALPLSAQETNIFIPSLSTDSESYSFGQTIKAEVQIDNNSDMRQSDLYITSSIVDMVDGQRVESDTQRHQKNLYLDSHAKKVIPFEHTIAAQVNGDVELVVTAYKADGTLVGQKKKTLKIINENALQTVVFKDAALVVNEEEFAPQVGPTVSSDDVVSISFTVGELPVEGVSIHPQIDLYNRTSLDNTPVKTVKANSITLESNTTYSIDLPVDMNPLVYEGKLSFDTSEYVIAPYYFRYIIGGEIGTILNLNASKLDVKKGDLIQVRIEYAGIPPVINQENSGTNDELIIEIGEDVDLDSLTNEDLLALVTQQETSTANESVNTAQIRLTLKDHDGNVIGEGVTQINLDESGVAVADIEITKASKGYVVEAVMLSSDEVVLSTYTTELPSEEEVSGVHDSMSWKIILLSSFVGLLVLLLLISIRKNFKQYTVVLILLIIPVAGLLINLNRGDAFAPEFEPEGYGASDIFKVNAVLSPGPADSVAYDPGEEFQLDVSASYIACSNSGFVNGLYGPSDDWTSFNLNGMESAFDEFVQLNRVTCPRCSKRYVSTVYDNIIQYTGDYWGQGYVIPRFAEWWTKSGLLTGQDRKEDTVQTIGSYTFTTPAPYTTAGFIQNGVTGKGGVKLFESSAIGTAVQTGRHDYSNTYTINPSKKYYMPEEPGFHTFYFMLSNNARGNTAANKIYSQTVCVRGKGDCIDEEPPTCNPETFTEELSCELGIEFSKTCNEDGTYEIVETGNDCPTCDPSTYNEELSCELGLELSQTCTDDGTYEIVETGNKCIEDNKYSCSASQVNYEQPTTYNTSSGASSYEWYKDGIKVPGESNRSYSLVHSTTGSKTNVKVKVTEDVEGEDSLTKTIQCYAQVNCDTSLHQDGERSECVGGYQNVYYCSPTGWATRSEQCFLPGDPNAPTASADPSLTTFKFEPALINPSADGDLKFCGLTLEVSDVSNCKLLSSRGPIQLTVEAGKASYLKSRFIPTGTYSLYCTGTGESPQTKFLGTPQTCVGNLQVREN